MMGDAVGGGRELVEGWIGCAVGFVRRLGAPLLEALARRGNVPPDAREPEAVDARRETAGPQTTVEEAKYWIGPADEPVSPRAVDREMGELPRAYGCDRIVLLPRDPWWTYTYWEVTPTTRIRALRALGADAEGAREVLRVYDVTFITFSGDNAWLSFDVELPPGADHWYLNVDRPAASFCVEVGLRTPGGRFLPLARSNVVTTPRSSPSPDTTVRWRELRAGASREIAGPWTGTRLSSAEEGGGDGSGDGRPRSSDVHAPLPR